MDARMMHLDVDAFFPSVEQADEPELQGKPLIIGGLHNRSVVASCSYEARERGVHSAMPMSQARKICPEAIIRPPRFHRYREVSTQLMQFLQRYPPKMQVFSIDEAFLDFQNTQLVYPDMEKLAADIQQILLQRFSLHVSIGLASNYYCAKMASNYRKPFGITILPAGTEKEFLASLPLERLWGLGPHTQKILHQAHIHSLRALQKMDLHALQRIVGLHTSRFLHSISQGKDPGILRTQQKLPSMSVERTYHQDLTTWEAIKPALLQLAQELSHRLLDKKVLGPIIRVRIRFSDFSTHTVQGKIPQTHMSTQGIYHYALSFLQSRWKNPGRVRLLGIGIVHIGKRNLWQNELFFSMETQQMAIDESVHALTEKFRDKMGNDALPLVRPARTLLLAKKEKQPPQ